MADNLTPPQRRKAMRAVKSRDTSPERAVRSIVHRLGFRFRLHGRGLPGSPDIVLPRHRAVIFVHGCFWHGHRCRGNRARPRTNAAYWRDKVARNRGRDRQNQADLRRAGWRTLVVWECQIRRADLPNRLLAFLSRVARWAKGADIACSLRRLKLPIIAPRLRDHFSSPSSIRKYLWYANTRSRCLHALDLSGDLRLGITQWKRKRQETKTCTASPAVLDV